MKLNPAFAELQAKVNRLLALQYLYDLLMLPSLPN